MVNFSAFAHYHARLTPDRTAVVYGDLTISWRDFAERIGRLAALLHARGVAPGDRVAACMKNAPAFLDLAFACSQVGAVFLPVNYRLAAAEIEYILANAEAKLLFADEELAARGARGPGGHRPHTVEPGGRGPGSGRPHTLAG